MEPELLCLRKRLTNSDVQRNLEIPNGAPFLPARNEVMLVRDKEGNIFQFRAKVRRGGRRSLTYQWRRFAVDKSLKVGEYLRISRSGNGNEYVVEVGLELFPPHIGWEVL
ncbi:unnamed protein product [Ilex paraguariensis]|uniref:TF-B3 domain-containing protein n=1 Tax=Ilex paraguariensis TaxID=185542 RepID=A0ABC8RH22_9AQUA